MAKRFLANGQSGPIFFDCPISLDKKSLAHGPKWGWTPLHIHGELLVLTVIKPKLLSHFVSCYLLAVSVNCETNTKIGLGTNLHWVYVF